MDGQALDAKVGAVLGAGRPAVHEAPRLPWHVSGGSGDPPASLHVLPMAGHDLGPQGRPVRAVAR